MAYDARGERLLLFAMLERAMADASNGAGDIWKGSEVERDYTLRRARRWIKIWNKEDFDREFTFPWVCSHLGVCPYKLRKCLVKAGFAGFRKSQLCTDRLLARFLTPAPTVDEELLYHHG